MSGTLFVVSIHLGNINDLTFRANRTLRECDFIICEEYKVARRLLKQLNIEKELISLNEHNEKQNAPLIIEQLKNGKSGALISDTGTPIFSDPGHYLINLAIANQIPISIVPGPDSLIPSLITSGFDISKFYFAGWLSPKKIERKKELKDLTKIKRTIAIMETPYRLKQLIEDIEEVFGKEIEISLSCDLTTEREKIIRGKLKEIKNEIMNFEYKPEFVLIINNKLD